MTSEEEFEELLEAVRRGDEAAASRLFRLIQPRLLRYLRSQEPRVADDIAAEVWLAVAGGLDTFQGDESGFRAWVFTIARRRVLDHRRRGVRRRTSTAPSEDFVERPDPALTSDPTVMNDSQEAVDLIVALLPPAQAEVIILRVVADLDADTVGELMGRSATWVRVTQHRALKRLAAKLRRPTDVTSTDVTP